MTMDDKSTQCLRVAQSSPYCVPEGAAHTLPMQAAVMRACICVCVHIFKNKNRRVPVLQWLGCTDVSRQYKMLHRKIN